MGITNQYGRREAPRLIPPPPSIKVLRLIQIIRLPKPIQGTRLLVIEPHPRLPFPTPMEQAHRSRMQGPTHPINIVPTKPMLVPPMINGLNIPRENKQERWQRTQFIDPLLPLELHPVLDPLPIVPFPPPHQVHDHHPSVEVTRPSRTENTWQQRVQPELIGEILSEICVAIFWGANDTWLG